MGAENHITLERFLARAALAEERAARANETGEKTMWEEIARCWRELARQHAATPA